MLERRDSDRREVLELFWDARPPEEMLDPAAKRTSLNREPVDIEIMAAALASSSNDSWDNTKGKLQKSLSSSLDWEDMPSGKAGFFEKYFANEQKLEKGVRRISGSDQPWYIQYRKHISIFIPITIVYLCYFSYMGATDSWGLFVGKTGTFQAPRWYVSITMVFGSMVAGATSEGGAAVAFPVLTLTMGVAPAVARDFSYLIQSVGMTSAAFSIWYMGVKVERHSVLYCTLGGIAGVIFGLELVAPQLTPPYSKMYFVSIWFSFAVSLYWVNHFYGGIVFDSIPHWDEGILWKRRVRGVDLTIHWKACLLLAFGFLGGIFSAMSGSGIDICSFALLCLLFRVNERVATPTSVVLMAINTVVAYMYRELKMRAVAAESYNLWLVCVPIVVIGAPLGAIVSSHFHRTIFAILIYLTDIAQFVGALVIIKPWLDKDQGGKTDTPVHLTASSAAIVAAGGIAFTALAFWGQYLLFRENPDLMEGDNERKEENKLQEVLEPEQQEICLRGEAVRDHL